jgi:hypothetical protein
LAPTEQRNTLALDFSRVQLLKAESKAEPKQQQAATTMPMLAPGELKLVNAILRPGARLHLISVAASYLALRFTPAATTAQEKNRKMERADGEEEEESSSLLVFARTAAEPAPAVAAAAAPKEEVAAPVAPVAKKPLLAALAAAVGAKKGAKEGKPRFKKALKGTPSNPYTSVFEYLEDEAVPLYLVLSLPTFLKSVSALSCRHRPSIVRTGPH